MRINPISYALLPVSLWTFVAARLHNSLVPEDPYAFPKYRVTFLNGLPVLNETAQQWLQSGLHGGEAEFLEQPLEEGSSWTTSSAVKSIGGGHEPETADSQPEPPQYKLELMKLGPRTSYLCMIPPPPLENTSLPIDESSTDVTPAHTWSLLQPLSGTCLYHKQGWFTYAYCHNSHVRQFHELAKPQAQRPGEYKPEEDTEWEAYTLGRAPPTPAPGAELTVAQEAAIAANVELARNAGSRYLVQRWADGTYCEKIGRKREIEIQFHCSMTMTDTILFVKETQTCHYVLHIATARLCGEPGFRSRADAREEAYVRCREVVAPEEYVAADRALPEADHPFKLPRRSASVKPVIAPPPPPPPAQDAGKDTGKGKGRKLGDNELVRRAIEKLLAQGRLGPGDVIFGDVDIDAGDDGEGGEFVVEFVDVGADGEDVGEARAVPMAEILRAVGYDVRGAEQPVASGRPSGDEGEQKNVKDGEEDDGAKEEKKKKSTRDEL